MGVQVTVIPHIVRCASTGKDVEFDQFQIRIGQRVVGYAAKQPGTPPSLVVRGLSEEALSAINAAVATAQGGDPLDVKASVAHPIGATPVKAKVPPPDPADSAELEASLEAEAEKKQ